jgi:hypothetical protein
MTWSRWERIIVKWSDYLIDNEIVRVNIFSLLTNLASCAFEEILQSDRRDLKEKILIEEWDKVDEQRRQWCVENVKKNDCS